MINIRRFAKEDIEAVVELSLLAWAPVFRSFERVLGTEIYKRIWPDWEVSQREGVETVCLDDDETVVWVAEWEGTVVGFLAYRLKEDEKTGEVYLLAVHPDHQNRGIGTALNRFALAKMKAAGMTLATVETGGDPGHAPARRTYEKAGYTGLPIVRYYRKL